MLILSVAASRAALADDAATTLTQEALRSAIDRSLPLLIRGANGSIEQRPKCFTCHGQGAAIRTLSAAKARGIPIDEGAFRKQVQFVADFVTRDKDRYVAGRGPGGHALTAGYALWALEEGSVQPDATTESVVEYLLGYQKDRDHWEPDMPRPPSEKSFFAASYVALRGLQTFGTPAQEERIRERVGQVGEWVRTTTAEETEDRVFRLWSLHAIGAEPDEISSAVKDLVKSQRDDGGWPQKDDMWSDPYSTGTALVALHRAGGMPTTAPTYQAGLRYLLNSQLRDGSWHVVTRSEPIMTYFESGFPHDGDQFLSMSATSWATTALILALPPRHQVP